MPFHHYGEYYSGNGIRAARDPAFYRQNPYGYGTPYSQPYAMSPYYGGYPSPYYSEAVYHPYGTYGISPYGQSFQYPSQSNVKGTEAPSHGNPYLGSEQIQGQNSQQGKFAQAPTFNNLGAVPPPAIGYPGTGDGYGYGWWIVLFILLLIIAGGYYFYSRGFFTRGI